MHIQKTKNKRKIFTVALLTILAMVIVYISVAATIRLYPFHSKSTDGGKKASFINHKKSAAEVSKEEASKKDPNTKKQSQSDIPTPPEIDIETSKQKVNVLISSLTIYDSKVEARGLITNTTEKDGTCTYIFNKDEQVIRKETEPLVNSTSITCSASIFNASELSSGNWNVTLEFSSVTSYGISDKRTLEVPR